jgi:hypothetical protein
MSSGVLQKNVSAFGLLAGKMGAQVCAVAYGARNRRQRAWRKN